MNKRMKDPKGDLRFVHKSTRVYDFWSLKLTAMAWKAGRGGLCEKKKEKKISAAADAKTPSRKASGSQTERTTISLRLCAFARKKNPRNAAGQASAADPQFCGTGTQPPLLRACPDAYREGVAPIPAWRPVCRL